MNETIGATSEDTNVVGAMVSDTIEETKQITSILNDFQSMLLSALPTIISAIVFLIIGVVAIKVLLKLTYNILDKSKMDKTAMGFIKSAIRIILYILLGIIVL